MAIKKLLKGEFPELRRSLDFGEFHPDLVGNSVDVWLNPSAEYRDEWVAFRDELAQVEGFELTEDLIARRAALWAKMWGCDAEDAAALFAQPGAAGLVAWLCDRTWAIMNGYAEERAKNGRG